MSSRNKIKRSLFLYCLYQSAIEYDTYFDMISALKDNNLSIENFNKALLKVKNPKKQFLNSTMEKQYKRLSLTYPKNKITFRNMIAEYNRVVRLSTQKGLKLNNNSILTCCIFNLLKPSDEKEFFTTFALTSTTLKKFTKIIE